MLTKRNVLLGAGALALAPTPLLAIPPSLESLYGARGLHDLANSPDRISLTDDYRFITSPAFRPAFTSFLLDPRRIETYAEPWFSVIDDFAVLSFFTKRGFLGLENYQVLYREVNGRRRASGVRLVPGPGVTATPAAA